MEEPEQIRADTSVHRRGLRRPSSASRCPDDRGSDQADARCRDFNRRRTAEDGGYLRTADTAAEADRGAEVVAGIKVFLFSPPAGVAAPIKPMQRYLSLESAWPGRSNHGATGL